MRIIRLTESDLEKIVKKVLREDPVPLPDMENAPLGKVEAIQQALVDAGYDIGPTGVDGKFGSNTRAAVIKYQKNNGIKQTGNVGPVTGGKLGVQPLVGGTTTQTQTTGQKQTTQTQTQGTSGCQVIGSKTSGIQDLSQIVASFSKSYPSVEPYALINRTINKYAEAYKSQGIPQRTACELGLIQIRPGYKDKNAFIVDTLNKILYLYNNKGQFIGKTDIISGKNKQSVDPKVIAKSLMTWDEQTKSLGFKWLDNKGYVDQTGKNRKYDPEIIYSDTDKSKTRFLPKGIYTTSGLGSDSDYAGKTQNVLSLYDGNKNLAQAIHGYYVEQPRTAALKKAAQVLSNPNDKRVSKEFMDLVANNQVNLSQSYGCINVPENFVPYLRKYGPNSYVFNMGEDKQNYLVQNTENYFEKMQNSQSCPSPQSLGAIPVNSENIA
jgi:peptidoglycan hydrolase-like protein with peptidoglycan-binding domain